MDTNVNKKSIDNLLNKINNKKKGLCYKMNIREESLQKHYEWNGKIEVIAKAKVNDSKSLSLAYTPGVAEPCLEIQKDYNRGRSLSDRSPRASRP